MGVWIALEDATIDNGCLWFIPGSHTSEVRPWRTRDVFVLVVEPIQRRYIRNSNEQEFNDGKMLIFKGEDDQYDASAFVPVEIKAGNDRCGDGETRFHHRLYFPQAMPSLFMVKSSTKANRVRLAQDP